MTKSIVYLSFISLICASIVHAQPPSLVEILPAEIQTVSRTADLVGTAEAVRRSRIAAQTQGAVKKRIVEAGDSVEEGAELIRQDQDVAKALLRAAKSAASAAEALHAEQLQVLKRSETLHDRGRISDEEFQSDRLREENLRQAAQRRGAEVEELSIQLDRLTIRAPYASVVVSTSTDPGEWLTPGEEVVELVDLSSLDIVVELPERFLKSLQRDIPVQLRPSAHPEQVYQATIDTVIPVADPATRTVPIRIRLPNENLALYPGMDMRVSVPVSTPREALVVPKDALINQAGNFNVFRVNDGTVESVPVTRKESYGEVVEVEGPLEPGDSIVVRGNERIRPGQSVTARPLNLGSTDESD